MNKLIIVLILSFSFLKTSSQNTTIDSLQRQSNTRFNYKALIIPTVLVGYGVFGLESHSLKLLNESTQSELTEHIDSRFTVDDFTQYAPFLSVYALNAFGKKGKHNFKDRTIILGTAYLIMAGSVNILKYTGNVRRPDGSSTNSFPSGHTATAFMGAEFLHQEYKGISLWYGISGYIVATGTGLFRMYNNRHWLTDVAAGAGIGILSTKIAYWLHPLIKKSIFKDKEVTNGIAIPFYNGREFGLSISMSF
ncbi:MAG: phosphatase PAP2 family protein [Winogradskyella sp.]